MKDLKLTFGMWVDVELMRDLFFQAQNRYHVPQGFHFHRIRVKLIDRLVFSSFICSS